MNFLKRCRSNWKLIFLICYPLSLLTIPIFINSPVGYYTYSLSLIAGLWLTEAIPSPITGFVPVFLHPLLGIQNSADIVKEYMKDSSLVFLGGFLVSSAFEYCGLHKRIALKVMIWSGTSLTTLLLGIMLTTMFLSMWMFNSAAAAMMVPIVLTVLKELQDLEVATQLNIENIELQNLENNLLIVKNKPVAYTSTSKSPESELGESSKNAKMSEKLQRLRTVFLLGICYSANLGGTGVLTGTGANLIAFDYLGSLDPAKYANKYNLTFTNWTAFAIVPMILNVLCAWIYLQLWFFGIPKKLQFWKRQTSNFESTGTVAKTSNDLIEDKIRKTLHWKYMQLGPISTHEIGVTIHFLSAVTLWIFHNPKIVPGWSQLFPLKIHIATGTLLMGILLFVIPRNKEFYVGIWTGRFSNVRGGPLLDWRFAEQRIPWGVFTLLGGGHALSKAAKSTGVAKILGQFLYSFASFPHYGIQLSCLLIIVFLTEIVSNSAVATLAIPILLDLSTRLEIHPLYLTFPSTIACSYAFMLPVATGPNAVVYAASDMKLSDMIKVGFFMNIIAVFITTICLIVVSGEESRPRKWKCPNFHTLTK